MLLDYNEYISVIAIADINKSIFSSQDKLFFMKRGWCPFCHQSCGIVDRYHDYDNSMFNVEHKIDACIWQCKKCGWWELQEIERYREGNYENKFTSRLKHGILKKFQLGDSQIPINALRDKLIQQPDVIYKIHHTKMEQLVCSIFSDYYECEVHHVGKTADGGIDLVFIESDEPIFVQIKRRMSPNSSESVSEVREFLGAVQLQKGKEAIFVTSANHFTKPASQAAAQAVLLGLVKRFELVDYGKLISLLHLTSNQNKKPWKNLSKWI